MIVFVNILIALYLAANIIFSASATFDTDWWDKIYFWYQDIAGAGWLVWLMLYMNDKKYRARVLPVLIYSITIFLWDIISYSTGWGVNHPTATGIMFGIGATVVLIFIIKDFVCHLKEL